VSCVVLGKGANSIVYKCTRFTNEHHAHHVAIKSPVTARALKFASSPEAVDEFRRSRDLVHANIVSIFMLDLKGTTVMEYVDGGCWLMS
jgi:hypothetical protein